eukprot:TRINITY_DN4655_c0_g1_i1.p1 TRINITY_DN4655_c0_g1~~TRINITY_DN4655_c0_g1_i1.p1  ORF type:complete len:241 (+),score=24.72 TRINITY_DN4655_c0_g1_i1:161-883(+)
MAHSRIDSDLQTHANQDEVDIGEYQTALLAECKASCFEAGSALPMSSLALSAWQQAVDELYTPTALSSMDSADAAVKLCTESIHRIAAMTSQTMLKQLVEVLYEHVVSNRYVLSVLTTWPHQRYDLQHYNGCLTLPDSSFRLTAAETRDEHNRRKQIEAAEAARHRLQQETAQNLSAARNKALEEKSAVLASVDITDQLQLDELLDRSAKVVESAIAKRLELQAQAHTKLATMQHDALLS